MPHCPYCSSRVTRHLHNHRIYWFCRSCWLRISPQELAALCPPYREEDICPAAGLSLEKQIGRNRRSPGWPADRQPISKCRNRSAERLGYIGTGMTGGQVAERAAELMARLEGAALREPELEKVPG